MALEAGSAPATSWLTARRSASELLQNEMVEAEGLAPPEWLDVGQLP